MNRFINEIFTPKEGDPNTWQAMLFENGEIVQITDKVKTPQDNSIAYDIKRKYGFNLFAITMEDQSKEFLQTLVTVKVCSCLLFYEVPNDFSIDKILYTIKDKQGNPEYFVYEDDKCEYWKKKRRKNKISNIMSPIF